MNSANENFSSRKKNAVIVEAQVTIDGSKAAIWDAFLFKGVEKKALLQDLNDFKAAGEQK